MIVYCDCRDCANWSDGGCDNKWPINFAAIKIDDEGRCTDYVPKPEEDPE